MLLQISFSLADALNLRTEIGTLEAMGVVGGGVPNSSTYQLGD